MNWYIGCLKKYAEFTGCASRMEYWMFSLINFAVLLTVLIVDFLVGAAGFLLYAYFIATVVPSIAVLVRRLRDANCSGKRVVIPLLISLLPLIPFLIPFLFPLLFPLFSVVVGSLKPTRGEN